MHGGYFLLLMVKDGAIEDTVTMAINARRCETGMFEPRGT
jgi:hypothetical protein